MRRALETLRGCLVYLAMAVYSFIGVIPLLPFGLIKLLVPLAPVRRAIDPILLWIARTWARAVNATMLAVSGAEVELHNSVPANPRGRYVLISNHQCWADVMLMVHILEQQQLPFPRFFIKEVLRWLPIVGFACWVLDFPFMKRYSKEQIAKNPALRGKDMETTKKSCEAFRQVPVTVVNFADGTRATPAKRLAQKSPYRFLLRPKTGGVAFTLGAMSDVLDGILDMTVAYVDTPAPTYWDFLCGRISKVRIQLRPLALPADLEHGDYQNDPAYRDRFRAWMNELWTAKDAKIVDMIKDKTPPQVEQPRKAS